jgi:23S rRNA (guanosine2251-2'-O)-methyltransferase
LNSEVLYRRNTVQEALRGDKRQIIRLWIQKDVRETGTIEAIARSRGVPIEKAEKGELSRLAGDSGHQGVVLETGPYRYGELDDVLALAGERGEKPFLLLFDLLHGPQNIGALLRAAEACGVHGVIIQDRRAPDITPSVVMYSAGATEHLHIVQVTNLVRTIRRLKEAEIWIVGLDLSEESTPLGQIDLDMALGIVIGHEGSGLRRLVRENCDFLLKLPMRGQIESLNAATAGAIVLYAAWQARDFEGASPLYP